MSFGRQCKFLFNLDSPIEVFCIFLLIRSLLDLSVGVGWVILFKSVLLGCCGYGMSLGVFEGALICVFSVFIFCVCVGSCLMRC